MERDGVGAVTHRSVAQEAGVAATAGTYHFPTVDDLLVAVITTGSQRFVAALGEPADLRTLADLAAVYLHADRGRAIAEYELYLLAARRPELRPAARLWSDAVRDVLARWTDDPRALDVAVAACDGLLLQGLIADDPPDAERIAATVRHALGRSEPG